MAATEIPTRHNGERKLDEKFAAKAKAWAVGSPLLSTTHDIYWGDARVMEGLRDERPVHLVVTSPPYWDLINYESASGHGQLGHISDRDIFLDQLDEVWTQCFERLTPGGRLCIVVGDVCRSRKQHGRHRVDPLHAHIQVRCQEIGFDPLATIFWHKIANMRTEAGGPSAFLGKPYEPNAVIKNDVEFILAFRKPGGYRKPSQEQRDLSLIEKEDHQRWFRQIWTDIPGESRTDHPAPYPSSLAARLISMYSFVGDTVLDPFWGIGNTTVAAIETHRCSVGFEVEPSYLLKAKELLSQKTFNSNVIFHD